MNQAVTIMSLKVVREDLVGRALKLRLVFLNMRISFAVVDIVLGIASRTVALRV